MSWLPRLLSRLAAIALIGVAALLFALFAVLPLIQRDHETREAIAFNAGMIDRLHRSIENRGAYETEIVTLEEAIAASGLYVRAATDALAAAAMQERLKRAISLHGGELRSIQTLPNDDEAGLVRIGLRVVMTGDNDAAIRLMHELETGEPYLFLDNLQINSTANRRRVGRKDEEPAPLALNFDIFGYLPPQEGDEG